MKKLVTFASDVRLNALLCCSATVLLTACGGGLTDTANGQQAPHPQSIHELLLITQSEFSGHQVGARFRLSGAAGRQRGSRRSGTGSGRGVCGHCRRERPADPTGSG